MREVDAASPVPEDAHPRGPGGDGHRLQAHRDRAGPAARRRGGDRRARRAHAAPPGGAGSSSSTRASPAPLEAMEAALLAADRLAVMLPRATRIEQGRRRRNDRSRADREGARDARAGRNSAPLAPLRPSGLSSGVSLCSRRGGPPRVEAAACRLPDAPEGECMAPREHDRLRFEGIAAPPGRAVAARDERRRTRRGPRSRCGSRPARPGAPLRGWTYLGHAAIHPSNLLLLIGVMFLSLILWSAPVLFAGLGVEAAFLVRGARAARSSGGASTCASTRRSAPSRRRRARRSSSRWARRTGRSSPSIEALRRQDDRQRERRQAAVIPLGVAEPLGGAGPAHSRATSGSPSRTGPARSRSR